MSTDNLEWLREHEQGEFVSHRINGVPRLTSIADELQRLRAEREGLKRELDTVSLVGGKALTELHAAVARIAALEAERDDWKGTARARKGEVDYWGEKHTAATAALEARDRLIADLVAELDRLMTGPLVTPSDYCLPQVIGHCTRIIARAAAMQRGGKDE